ncbi:flagellum-specific ATP synthase FliI [Gammaproteobacteria bacterium]
MPNSRLPVQTNSHQRWAARLKQCQEQVERLPRDLIVEGRVTRMVGLTLEAVGVRAAIGGRCHLVLPDRQVDAEVVGFHGDRLFLMPSGDIRGLMPNARVVPGVGALEAPVGEGLLGRIIDGAGVPLDGKGPLTVDSHVPLNGVPINPLSRQPIHKTLDVGVRAINALLSVGQGQRMGLFAGSGVGKSVLLGMMTKFTNADVIVVGLIGERGREVKEFIENILGKEGLVRSVVVAAPADSSPLLRMQGAALATSIAEWFRNRGRNVLLLMDSLTRYAQAGREIALAIGEPPATKGYPPSVFARLPALVERAGNGDIGGGSITAFYTVLTEGDDQQDPIADAARAILDGHVVLSRSLAESGHYPAIDVEASISRVMPSIASTRHQEAARQFKRMYSTYRQHADLISVGAYVAGSNPRVDEAISMYPRLQQFLQQDMNQPCAFQNSLNDLNQLIRV